MIIDWDELYKSIFMSKEKFFDYGFEKKYGFEFKLIKGYQMETTQGYVDGLSTIPSTLDITLASSIINTYRTESTLEKFENDFKQKYGFEFSLLVETFKKEKEELFI